MNIMGRPKTVFHNLMINGVRHRYVHYIGGCAVRNMETNKNTHYKISDMAKILEIPVEEMKTFYILAFITKDTPEFIEKFWSVSNIQIGDLVQIGNGPYGIYTCTNKEKYKFELTNLSSLKPTSYFVLPKEIWKVFK